MSQTFTTPSAAPVAKRVPVWSTASTTTGVVCGLMVRKSSYLSVRFGVGLKAYIRIDKDLEQMIRWDEDGVTVGGVRTCFIVGEFGTYK